MTDLLEALKKAQMAQDRAGNVRLKVEQVQALINIIALIENDERDGRRWTLTGMLEGDPPLVAGSHLDPYEHVEVVPAARRRELS